MARRYPLKPIRPRLIRGRGVMAAYPPFKRQGGGSSPSGPTTRLVAQRQSRPLIRVRRGFDSHPSLMGPRCCRLHTWLLTSVDTVRFPHGLLFGPVV